MLRTSRARIVAIDVAVVAFIAVAIAFSPDDPRPAPAAASTVRVQVTYQGKTVRWWARHAVAARRDANARGATIRRLDKVIAGKTSIVAAIDLAAIAYHVDPAMLRRKGSCESTGGHGYDASATGAPISDGEKPMGLFQFIGSTWATTPYAGFSPYDPLAAALAAAWMHANGRAGEFQCR